MKGEQHRKETRIAVRFPRHLISKIDDSVARGFGESRSGCVRGIVAQHFEEERQTRSLLLRLADSFSHPLLKVFASYFVGNLFNTSQYVSKLDLDGQREFFEKFMDPFATAIAQVTKQPAEELRKQLVGILDEHERKQRETITGRQFIEVMAKYAGKQTEPAELAGMMHELRGVPMEQATHWVQEWLDRTPPEKRSITVKLTPKPGSEENARKLLEALAASQKSKRARGKDVPGEGGIEVSVQIDTQSREVTEVSRALNGEAEYSIDSKDLGILVEEYVAVPWCKVMERKTAAEFLGRLIGKPADLMERTLEEIEHEHGKQQINLEAAGPSSDDPTLQITFTCQEDRSKGWMVECAIGDREIS